MGLGPSMKMTTLHHYRCLLTAELARQSDITFAEILADAYLSSLMTRSSRQSGRHTWLPRCRRMVPS